MNKIIGTGGFAGGGATAVGLADDADSVVNGGLAVVASGIKLYCILLL